MEEIVLRALSRVRAPVVLEENGLHEIVAGVLGDAGVAFVREKRLGRCRLDFLCEGGVAIEVKRNRPPRRVLLEQIRRYARLDEVRSLVVVSEAPIDLPDFIAQKHIYRVALRALWGVALP